MKIRPGLKVTFRRTKDPAFLYTYKVQHGTITEVAEDKFFIAHQCLSHTYVIGFKFNESYSLYGGAYKLLSIEYRKPSKILKRRVFKK